MPTTGPRAIKPQASVWFSERAGGKRKKAEQPTGLDPDKIVKATVRLLDADGLARFSMRRLAAELGVTPMSVYWYVDNKDDLLEMALDEVNGEIPVPDEGGDADWRTQLRDVATAFRRMLVAHPWASRLMGEFMNAGPHATAFSTAAYRLMQRTGLPEERIPGALSAVYQFAYGFATVEGRWVERCRTAGIDEDDLFRELSGAIRHRPEFEGMAEFIEQRAKTPVPEMRERDFGFALDCVIAGIESMRDRADRG